MGFCSDDFPFLKVGYVGSLEAPAKVGNQCFSISITWVQPLRCHCG